MNFFAVGIAAKEGDRPVIVSLVTMYAKDSNEVWATLIGDAQYGLNPEVEGLASIKEALTAAKASELTKDDVYNFVLAVEENPDIDITVVDITEGMNRKPE